MAKKRPEFNLPSTKPATAPAKTDWVYKSEAASAKVDAPKAADSRGERTAYGELIVERYATYAAGASIIPIPYLDVLAIGGLQLKMIAELTELYGVLFNEEVGKSLIAATLGSIGATRLAYEVGGSLLKVVPVVGVIGSVLAMPVVGYSVTWAIGRVFVMHFESGGTLLDFDATRMRAHFEKELSSARATS